MAAHCPTLSGIDDGILANPLACTFDPGWVQCMAGNADTSACLTAEEVAVAKKICDGPQDASGRLFEISGFPVGSERQWSLPGQTAGTPGGPGGGGRGGAGGMAGGSIKYLLLPTVSPDSPEEIMAKFTFSHEWFDRVREMGYLYNAANTNLRPFADRGGKLIVWHGGADTSVPPAISIAYYQRVQKELGEKRTDAFMRFFLLPGVGHCGGGDGPSQLDVFTPLIAWTEQKRAPEKIVVGKTAGGPGMGPGPNMVAGGQIVGRGGPGEGRGPGGPGGSRYPYSSPASATVYTRPVYPYPMVARYVSKGDPNAAANYEPVKAPVKTPITFTTEATKLIGPNNQKFYRVEEGKLVEDKGNK